MQSKKCFSFQFQIYNYLAFLEFQNQNLMNTPIIQYSMYMYGTVLVQYKYCTLPVQVKQDSIAGM